MRMKLICAILVGSLMVLAAGCGGGSDNKAESTSQTTTTETTTTTEDNSSADDSSAGKIALTSEDCQKLAAVGATIGQALSGTIPEGLDSDIARLEEVAASAPEEIQADLQVVAAAAQKFAELGITANSTPDEVMAKVGQLSQSIDLAKLNVASQNIATWAQENCSAG